MRRQIIFAFVIAIFTFLAFSPSLRGEFVYDDNRQIVQNVFIQNPELYGRALLSDVWAFKGDGKISASNYWRPIFTLWMIVNYNLFGLDPKGWHLACLLLHIFVCLVAFGLLLSWRVNDVLGFTICLLFAIHPTRVESVVWLAGVPDLLAALFLLLSFYFVGRQGRANFLLSVVFYSLALGAKEIVILCFPIYFLILRYSEFKVLREQALHKALFFLAVSIFYFVARYQILGFFSIAPEDAVDFGSAILSVPSVFLFYVKQILFPLNLAANYPLRPVSSFTDALISGVISFLILSLLLFLARRSFVQKLGLAVFLLTLVPAMNISLFPSEQIVHDRYLYLPLFGFLLVVFPEIKKFCEKDTKVEAILIVVSVIMSLILGYKTFTYSQVWLNDLSLWNHTVKVDNASAFNWLQYGAELLERERAEEAEMAYNRSLEVKPLPLALVGRARSLVMQKRYDEAIRDLESVIKISNEKVNLYTLFQAYEAIAIAFFEKKEYEKAISYLLEARRRLPIYYASLTVKIAVVLYQMNRKQEALKELEEVRERARQEVMIESKSVFFRLGLLYAEQGRNNEARRSFEEFLKLTAGTGNKVILSERQIALNYLRRN